MIRIENLDKIYNQEKTNSYHALKNINLHIEKNDLVLLKGVSGSGKSTLLSIIASFTKPTNGLLEIKGEQTPKLPDEFISKFRQENIGFVFQSFNLFERLSVWENILAPLVSLDIEDSELEKRIEDALVLANIFHKKDQMISDLSGGEKQRCAIARAIVNDPQIILCDEPTANLDKKNAQNFLNIIKDLKKIGKTIIISTHDTIFDDLDIVDKIVDLEDGEIVA